MEVEGTDIRYLGGGKYKLSIIAKDYKIAETILKDALGKITDSAKGKGAVVNFDRDGKRS